MADSAVAITAGSGTNVDTRTEGTNGNHRQVVVLGDPATNAGVAPVSVTAGLKVDLGADNDITLATLPDTASGDLAAWTVSSLMVKRFIDRAHGFRDIQNHRLQPSAQIRRPLCWQSGLNL